MSYLKGKDIKQKGDCLTHLFIKKLDVIGGRIDGYISGKGKPEGFEKW